MPTVAITDYTFPDLSLEKAVLRPEGVDIVSFKEKRPAQELSALVRNADAVIVQFVLGGRRQQFGPVSSSDRARRVPCRRHDQPPGR